MSRLRPAKGQAFRSNKTVGRHRGGSSLVTGDDAGACL
jgi:hypothetical protein